MPFQGWARKPWEPQVYRQPSESLEWPSLLSLSAPIHFLSKFFKVGLPEQRGRTDVIESVKAWRLIFRGPRALEWRWERFECGSIQSETPVNPPFISSWTIFQWEKYNLGSLVMALSESLCAYYSSDWLKEETLFACDLKKKKTHCLLYLWQLADVLGITKPIASN